MFRSRTACALLLAVLAAGCARTSPKTPRPPIVDLQVDPAQPVVAVGDTLKVIAQAVKADDSTEALDAADWAVADPAAISVESSKGIAWVTGLKPGDTQLTVSALGFSKIVTVSVTGAIPLKLELSPSETTVARAGVATFTAVVTMTDTTTSVVTDKADWSVSDSTIAGAGTAKGTFTGLKAGEVQVTAKYQTLSATAKLTVKSAALTRVDVTPSKLLVPLNIGLPLKAVAVYDDLTTSDVTDQADWTSSQVKIATVSTGASPRGVVTGLAAGDSIVTATYGGKSGTSAVTVTTAQLLSVEVDPPTLQLAKGTSGALTATALFSGGVPPQDVTALATWSSADATIASTSATTPGAVKGEGVGSTQVSATFLTAKGSASVTVTGAKLVAIAVNPAKKTVAKGASVDFTAVGTYSDTSTQDLTTQALWSSSDAAVAQVSNAPGSQGVAQAKSPGAATISAQMSGVLGAAALTVTAAEVVSLVIDPAFSVVAKGTSAPLKLTATFTDSSTLDATDQGDWSSSDNLVASVTTLAAPRGVVSAVKPGQVTITAAFQGKQATATVVISPATLVSITVDPVGPSLSKGATLQLRATGTYSDGTKQDVTALVIWSAVDAAIVSVSNAPGTQGLVTALSPGTTDVKASLSGVSGKTTVTVTPATLTALIVAPTPIVLDYHKQQQIVATAIYSDGTQVDVTASASWTSQDSTVADVTSTGTARGLITGNRAGHTTVTASFNGKSATVDVTVNAPKISKLEIRPSSLSLAAGKTGQLTCWATYEDLSQVEVTLTAQWSASLGKVSVDAKGLVTAITQGQDTVTATYSGLVATATVTVTAPDVDSLVLTPTNPSLHTGGTQAFTVRAYFTDGTSKDVTALSLFTTDDTMGVISLAANSATALKPGTVHITASYGGKSATTSLTVVGLVSLSIDPPSAQIYVNTTQVLKVTATYSDGSTADVSVQTVFVSADPSTVTLNGNTAMGMKVGGPVTITATFGGKSVTASIQVLTAKMTSLKIFPSGSINVQKGSTVALQAFVYYSDGSRLDVTSSCSWSTSNPAVCTVAGGTVTAKGVGSATVSAGYSGLSDSVTIVVQAPTLNRIALVPPNAVLRPNLIYPYRSYALYSDGTVTEVPRDEKYWRADNPSIAEPFNYTGYFGVWAQGVGMTNLYVNYDVGMGQTGVQVLNSPITGVEVSPAKVVLPVGTAAKLAGVFAYKSFGDGWAVEIQNPDWSTHDATVVTVDANGVATAKKVGTSAIDVTAYDASTGSHTATAQVQVTSATITSISLALPTKMVVGLSARVHAMGTFSDGTVMDLGPSPVIWSTTNNSLATVTPQPDGTGVVVNAKAAGSVSISAQLGSVISTVPITLVSTTLSTIALNVTQTTLAQGGTSLVSAQGTFADGTVQDLTWSVTYTSSAPDVAQVINGLFTTLDWLIVQAHEPNATPASASLTASFLGQTSPAVTITVNGANLRSLALALGSSPPAPTLTLSGPGPFQLRVVGTFTDNSTADVTSMCTFEPASPTSGVVATISNARAGQVALVGHGSEQIKATYAPSYIGQPLITGTATLVVP